MKIKEISTGYTPRPLQLVLHNSLKRFNSIICHRRFGKTHFAVNEIIDKAFRCPLRNPQFAYVGPSYGQNKRVVWDVTKDYLRNIPGVETNESDLRIEIPRPNLDDKIKILLLSADNPTANKGIYLDGVVLDEFAECDPRIWSEVIRPTLSDRKGWAIFIGTPKGQNHFYDIHQQALKDPKNWFSAIYKASETGILDSEELAMNKQTMSEEEYDQEYQCSFTAALIGSYYGKLMGEAEDSSRITNVPYDPSVLVDTFWDLGVGDTTVIWFIQQVGKEIRAIDYYEMSGVGLPHYAKLLKEKPYSYGEHVLPHDSAARSMETGRSRLEVLRDLGIRCRILAKHTIEDGINAARVLLPRMWFDRKSCDRGINALKNYERKWDPKNKIFSDTPLHNWASNAADGFRYMALGLRDESRRVDKSSLPRFSDRDFDIFQAQGENI